MIKVYNNIIPFKGYLCMNVCGILFVRNEYKDKIDSITINHESIHTKQMLEMGIIFFYLWYITEWFIKIFKYWNTHTAYRNISFEKEAYSNEYNIEYLTNRNHYTWLGLI